MRFMNAFVESDAELCECESDVNVVMLKLGSLS